MGKLLKIAIQKSGRLSDSSLSLIKECGIKFSNGQGKLKCTSFNFPLELLFLRDDDIPKYVADGVSDIGIVGENMLAEKDSAIDMVKRLGFSKCRISLAIPKTEQYTDIQYFQGKNIATSYPRILRNYLTSKGIKADIHEISGSVEIAPSIGLAAGICDIVSSGSTLLMNGLKEVEEVFQSESVLISHKHLNPSKKSLLNDLIFRIDAVQTGKNNKYVLLNAPNSKLEEIIKILPGMKSPTVLSLAKEGWSSVHTVISEDEFWNKIETLKKLGAQGILVIPIEKMIV